MTYTKKEGKSTKTYEVSYDKEQLKELLNIQNNDLVLIVSGKYNIVKTSLEYASQFHK